MAKQIEIKVTVVLDEERIKETFENAEIRYSKKKATELAGIVSETEPDIIESLEETFMECLQDAIYEEWGE